MPTSTAQINHHARFLDSTPAAQSSRGASERRSRPMIAHGDVSRMVTSIFDRAMIPQRVQDTL
jgi:hypothetical protein